MKRWGILLIISCIGVSLLAHLLGWLPHSVPLEESSSNNMTTAPAVDVGSFSISALGHIEPAQGIIDIGATPGDRIIRFGEGIEVGKHVEKNAEIAELESYELRTLEVELAGHQVNEAAERLKAEKQVAQANVEAAKLSLRQAESQNSQQIATQRQKINLLEKNHALAELTKEQFESLHNKNSTLVADTDLKRYQLLEVQAKAELDAGKALLDELERTGPFTIEAAKAGLAAAEASAKQIDIAMSMKSGKTQEKLARAQQKRSRVLALCAGTVLEICTPLFQPLGHEPILRMANLKEIVAVAEVFETDVQRIKLGQTALIKSRAFPAPYNEESTGLHGRVIEISRIVRSSSLEDRNPFAPQDRHIVQVRIALTDNKEIDVAAQYLNLQVTVVFPSPHELSTIQSE